MVYFVKLVESRDFVEDSVNEHIEKIVNEHDADDLRDQFGGLWERLPVAAVADVQEAAQSHHEQQEAGIYDKFVDEQSLSPFHSHFRPVGPLPRLRQCRVDSKAFVAIGPLKVG